MVRIVTSEMPETEMTTGDTCVTSEPAVGGTIRHPTDIASHIRSHIRRHKEAQNQSQAQKFHII